MIYDMNDLQKLWEYQIDYWKGYMNRQSKNSKEYLIAMAKLNSISDCLKDADPPKDREK